MEPDEWSGSASASGGRSLREASGRERLSGYLYDRAALVFPLIVIGFVLGPWLVEELGARDAHYMVAFAGSVIVALVLAPVVGALSHRIGPRPVLITSTMVAVLSMALMGAGTLLGFRPGGALLVALLFFVISVVGFQSGIVALGYRPAGAVETRGRTGAMGIAVGYVGGVAALALMFVGLEVMGWGEPLLFVAAGGVFLLFAIPVFLSVKDRPVDGPSGEAVERPVRSAWQTMRHLPRHRMFSRFLLTRSLYADAMITLVLVMGVYAVTEIGFVRDASGYYALLGIGVAFAVLSAPLWGVLVHRVGPRHTLMVALAGWIFLLAMVVVHPLLGLPQTVFYLIAGLIGVFLVGAWTSDRPLLDAMVPTDIVGRWDGLFALPGRSAAVLGPLLWAFGVDVVFAGSPGARQVGVLSLLVMIVLAMFLLRRLPDPYVSGSGPLARILPWGDGSGRPLQRAWRLPVRAPFFLLYIAVTWFVFFVVLSPQPHADPGTVLYVPSHQVQGLYFHIPDLVEAPHKALLAVFTAPLVNVHFVQLVYVSVLLLLFGLVFEVREGTLRSVLVFLATSAFASLVAAVVHTAVYPGLIDHPILERAQITVWTGGSAGAFGIMGAMAARARTPWPLLVLFAFWEVNVGFWFLRSYTPAFHLSALAGGFLLMRYVVPHKVPPGTRRRGKGPDARRPLAPPRGVPPDRS